MDEEDALFARFSIKSLERELASAVENEATRRAVDEMKKKAIKSAGSYDDFKNLVACAQQKPVDSGSLLTFGAAKCTRNRTAAIGVAGSSVGSGSSAHEPAPLAAVSAALSASPVPLPANVHEFTRDWARACATPAAKYAYVAAVPPKRLRRIFGGELDSAILSAVGACFADVLRDLCAGVAVAGCDTPPAGVAARMLAVLNVFASVDRFGLTLGLLTPSDVTVLRAVFDGLHALCADAAAVHAVRGTYGLV